MTISEKLYTILVKGGSWKTILGGLWVTVQIFVLSLVPGAVICLLRTRNNLVLRGVASAYIAVLRGTPVLMLLLLLYYGVLARTGLKPVTVAVFTFALNVSAHVAELLRWALRTAARRRRRGRWAFPPGIPSGSSRCPRCCASPSRCTSPPS